MGIILSQPVSQGTQIIHVGAAHPGAAPVTPTPVTTIHASGPASSAAPAASTAAAPAGAQAATAHTSGGIPGLPPFKSIEKALFPLSGQQIHQFRGKVRKTQDAGNVPVVPKKGITQVITINPNSGQTPTIHMAAGYACAITVVDGAGQPWPILSATIGSGSRFSAQPIAKNALEPTIVVSDLLPHAQSNMLLTLQGMNTPIPVQLVSGGPIKNGQETVAYRVILRVRGMVPGSLPASFSPSPNHGTTAALLQALYGTMPPAAKVLRVKAAPDYSYTRAWLLNGDLWIRSHARLLAPAWIATEASANGVHAYVLPQTHAVLMRFEGINHTVEVR